MLFILVLHQKQHRSSDIAPSVRKQSRSAKEPPQNPKHLHPPTGLPSSFTDITTTGLSPCYPSLDPHPIHGQFRTIDYARPFSLPLPILHFICLLQRLVQERGHHPAQHQGSEKSQHKSISELLPGGLHFHPALTQQRPLASLVLVRDPIHVLSRLHALVHIRVEPSFRALGIERGEGLERSDLLKFSPRCVGALPEDDVPDIVLLLAG